MGARAMPGDFGVSRQAIGGKPFDQRGMVVRVKTGIHMQGHDLKGKRQDALPDPENFEQGPTVHAAGYGHADPRAGRKHARCLHQLAHKAHTAFLRIGEGESGHENFPSNTASDDTEYLTLIYLNKSGIHAISCAENDALYYSEDRTSFYLKDNSKCILPDIMRLEWELGMECPWAGSLYAALKYMGEDYTYEQIMGISGACYRVCFVDVWDWSCTDALVSFDYAAPLYNAIGYTPEWAERLEKGDRKDERFAIMHDLQDGKPVLICGLHLNGALLQVTLIMGMSFYAARILTNLLLQNGRRIFPTQLRILRISLLRNAAGIL
jgi:hypothetical protein